MGELEGMVGGRLEERERAYRRKLRAAVAECRSSRVRRHAAVSAPASDAGERRRHGGEGDGGGDNSPVSVRGASSHHGSPPDGRRMLSVTISSRQGGGGGGRIRSNSHA